MLQIKLIDDSHYSRVRLGPSFTVQEPDEQDGLGGLKQMVEAVNHQESAWKLPRNVAKIQLINRMGESCIWQLGVQETATYPKRFRPVVQVDNKPLLYSLEVLDSFELHFSHADLAGILPESIYGLLIGFAAGATEAGKYIMDALCREKHTSEQLWRAPRFSFSFSTAAGSPFIERWAFAVQESAAEEKQFRLWVEQQRTGREFLLHYTEAGFDGLAEIEALPAAVHGAAIGMALGMQEACQRMRRAFAEGVLDTQVRPANPAKLKCFSKENHDEAEAVLQEYVDSVRTARHKMMKEEG